MKIESLREPTVRGGRYTVTLDDGRRLRLEQATVGEFALYPGRELTAEELNQIRAANQRASAKARAVRIILLPRNKKAPQKPNPAAPFFLKKMRARPVSRVLSGMIIYLGLPLPAGSRDYRRA